MTRTEALEAVAKAARALLDRGDFWNRADLFAPGEVDDLREALSRAKDATPAATRAHGRDGKPLPGADGLCFGTGDTMCAHSHRVEVLQEIRAVLEAAGVPLTGAESDLVRAVRSLLPPPPPEERHPGPRVLGEIRRQLAEGEPFVAFVARPGSPVTFGYLSGGRTYLWHGIATWCADEPGPASAPPPAEPGHTAWRCGCGTLNHAACSKCGKGPDERYASRAELDALAAPRSPAPGTAPHVCTDDCRGEDHSAIGKGDRRG